MTQASIRANVHQTLYTQLNFRPKGTFNPEFLGDISTDRVGFFIVPILYFFVPRDTGAGQDFLSPSTANTIDIRETYFASFVVRNVNSCYTCHEFVVR
jgi:hypothetical protein